MESKNNLLNAEIEEMRTENQRLQNLVTKES